MTGLNGMRPALRRLLTFLLLWTLVYAGCIALFVTAAGTGPADNRLLWRVWLALGIACLSGAALEFSTGLAWAWTWWKGFRADGGVPLRLTAEHRRVLEDWRPATGILMPAHCEASSEEDRAGLVDRIYDIVTRTPSWSTFFLLADSPPDQEENERAVIQDVKRRLRAAGREADADRVVLEEYRDKPPTWRHKCGSILRWVQRHGAKYEFMFLLDADSALAEEDPEIPQTCNVLERMMLRMRDDRVAMVQSCMHIRDYQSSWGWVQAVNSRIGVAYYFKVFAYLYGRNAPSYGHSCVMRVRDFAEHASNTLAYTSHDHIDASDLAAAGRACVLTDAAVTLEQPEDSLLMWIKRECRWARGNGQWIAYLLKKRRLPLAPAVFLVVGIMQYVLALFAGLFFIASVALVPATGSPVGQSSLLASWVVIVFVTVVLSIPKLLASPSVRDFLGVFALSTIMGPALVLYQGIAYVMGAFGTRWVPRGGRSNALDGWHLLRIARVMLPVSVIGFGLWPLANYATRVNWVTTIMYIMLFSMILSPLTGMLVSLPIRRPSPAPASSAGAQPQPA